jgi:hypothetical protein
MPSLSDPAPNRAEIVDLRPDGNYPENTHPTRKVMMFMSARSNGGQEYFMGCYESQLPSMLRVLQKYLIENGSADAQG